MISGQYRTDHSTRFWSKNPNGYCTNSTCHNVAGNLQHILLVCPAYQSTRGRLFDLLLHRMAPYPEFCLLFKNLSESTLYTRLKLILDPSSLPEIIHLKQLLGPITLALAYYCSCTFPYGIHKQRLLLSKNL